MATDELSIEIVPARVEKSTAGFCFASFCRGGGGDICELNLNGSDLTRRTFDSAWDTGAVWSADGTKIGFQSDRDAWFEIYVTKTLEPDR